MKANKAQTQSERHPTKAARRTGLPVSAVWLFFALFVAVLILQGFSYFSSNRPRGTSPSRKPTNIAAAPMVSSPTNVGPASPAAGVPSSFAVRTNSPLLDPSFKMADDPVELLNYGTALL